jgi:hypothetical protein
LQGCVPASRPQGDKAEGPFPCKSEEADARTRTGDPFITSYRRLSRHAIVGHSRPLCSAESPD